jgi:hypothetical protein
MSSDDRPFHQAGIGFLLAYAVPVVVIASVLLAERSGFPNAFTFLPLAVAYGLVPLIIALWRRPVEPRRTVEAHAAAKELFYRATLWFGLPVQLATLYIAGDLWGSDRVDGIGRVGLLLSTGIYGAIFGVVIAHELIHRDRAVERFLGGLILSTVTFGDFKIAHLRIHHRFVGTPLDFATAKRGDSIYGYWLRCFVGHFRETLRFERLRLANTGAPPWMSELVVWYGFSALWLTAAILLWGWKGAVFFLGQSLIAIMKFDCINFLQHYGLCRKLDDEGKFEPVQEHHAWTQHVALDDLILLNLPRHGEHHMHPQRPYPLLQSNTRAPEYPYNYAVMTLVLLVPPLFRSIVHPLLDRIEPSPTPRQGNNFGYQLGLIGFTSTTSVVRHLNYLIEVRPRYALRLLLVIATSLCALPLRALETIRFGRSISRVRLQEDPIFIIGHWRSGTTHLHNLMGQDPAFGYLSMYQAMVPKCSLVGGNWLKALLARIVPLKRPMDNMVWPMDAPQEEEIPLAKLTPYSFYTRFLFPRRSQELFDQYVLLHGARAAVTAELKRIYYRLLQTASVHAGGKRLILKNPVNTARVGLLLEMFPNAKFIHACRCPYDVYASMVNLYRELLAITTLQPLHTEKTGETITTIYEGLMRRFFQDRSLIPRGNLVEVRFEDLERDPLGETARIYRMLDLPGYVSAEPAFRAYIASQSSYRKNRLVISPEERARIEQRWAFAFDTLGYRLQEAVEPAAMPVRI